MKENGKVNEKRLQNCKQSIEVYNQNKVVGKSSSTKDFLDEYKSEIVKFIKNVETSGPSSMQRE